MRFLNLAVNIAIKQGILSQHALTEKLKKNGLKSTRQERSLSAVGLRGFDQLQYDPLLDMLI